VAKGKGGWYGESKRHSLAAKGIKTGSRTPQQMRSDAKRTVGKKEVDPLAKAKKEAYRMGYEEGLDIYFEDPSEIEDDEVLEDIINDYMDNLSQTDYYANGVLPELRKLAGYKDHGVGTYTDGDEEEGWNLEELHDEYDEGVMRGIHESARRTRKSARG
jgi:regulator of RNase E activity RraB